MALPGPDQADQSWPPYEWDPIGRDHRLWSAWFSGKPSELAWAYGNIGGNSQVARAYFRNTGQRNANVNRPGSYRGGQQGTIDRTFWGTPPPAGEKRTKVHIPLAGDIASMSADLLFAKRVKFESDGSSVATAEWCDERFDDDLHSTLLEGGELCSGLGGIYLRTAWDTALSDRSWIDLVHADAVVPTFRQGKLVSCIFWRVLIDDGDEVHRHLEEHNLVNNTIQHSVYLGDQLTIGMAVPVTEYPDLEPTYAALDNNNMITLPDIAPDASTVAYVPNMRPNRIWRHVRGAASIGRSDYSGIEGLMDSLDETYSAWMRDIRLAKSRLMVPPDYLHDLGPGKGAMADTDREVFVPLKMLTGNADGTAITANQFLIRWEEHSRTMDETIKACLRSAGYSQQDFGDSPTVAVTATEVEDRKQRSLLTRQRKIQYWRVGLRDALYSLQWTDKTIFRRNVTPQRPTIVWPEAVLPSLTETSQTVVAMANAQAASKQTMVQLLHPDWTDDQVMEEVQMIRDESALDVLGRAKITLAPPMGSTATIGQDVEEIVDDVQVTKDTSGANDPDRELSA